ncbi:dynamin family protein [Trichocoleus sp. DQ-A3]|uniref:dynamin family protein n=1 Tax=Cyanophyceae TaxID=3028117 RepID=UPI0016885A3C|nr:dynamin family protein [Coleofasciculus sp. FACHB-125]MBD1902786.1 dynamin family protein [Coleofasciculus sp. FACHB-125]
MANLQGNQQRRVSSFAEFQKFRKELDKFYNQLFNIFQEGNQHNSQFIALITKIEKASKKLQSQRFRIAVVGEFSRGKSTLINALVGEEIQPVRAIACNRTITVLKHGLQKRIVCHYKNGRQENISYDEYKLLVTISKEAARDYRSDELGRSEIEEIIFEHPNLEFCKNGVELVDSPGLNEHPHRAAITKKLLKDTDAVIFILNASQILTSGERNLIHDLRSQICEGKNEPANNLFIVVNKLDQLEHEKDRQEVKEEVENFLYGKSPIVTGDNRVHFISALKASPGKIESQYLNLFKNFSCSVENFLTSERGFVEIKQSATTLKGIIEGSLNIFQELENDLNDKIKASEVEKQKFIEQIGEVSGQGIKIRLQIQKLMSKMMDKVKQEVYEDWKEWLKEGSWEEVLRKKSEQWNSDKNLILDQKGIVTDYVNQFSRELSEEINKWAEKKIKEIVKHNLEILDKEVNHEIQSLYNQLNIDEQKFQKSFNDEYGDFASSYTGGFAGDFIDYLIGAVLVGLLGLLGYIVALSFTPAIGLGIAAAVIGAGAFGMKGIYDQIKKAVFEECKKQFLEVEKEIVNKIIDQINLVISKQFFQARLSLVDKIVGQAISTYEACLEEQERKQAKILEQCEAEKAFIAQKRRELEQVQKNIKAILPS